MARQHRNSHKNSYQAASGLPKAFVFGVIFFVMILWSWIFFCSISRLVSNMVIGYLLAIIGFSVIVGISCACILVPLNYAWHLQAKHKTPYWWFVATIFFVWAALEWLIAHLVTLVWLGHGGSVDTVLPFTSFTPLVAHTPLRFAGRLVGYYGLSAAIGTVLFCACSKRYRAFLPYVLGILCAICLVMWAWYAKPSGKTARVAVVSESGVSRVPVIADPLDLVVFPEYGFDSVTTPDSRVAAASNHTTYAIGSEEQLKNHKKQNVLVLYSNTAGIVEQRPKSRLIPGGEYMPYFADYAMQAVGGNSTKQFFNDMRAIERGPYNPRPLQLGNGLAAGSSACASIIAPSDYRAFTKNGANVLTNSAALGIFQSPVFFYQHLGMAQFMASANARPFLQSSNDANGYIINHNGKPLARTTPSPHQLKEATITTNTRKTPYTIFGEWPVFIGWLLIGVITAKRIFAKQQQRRTTKTT